MKNVFILLLLVSGCGLGTPDCEVDGVSFYGQNLDCQAMGTNMGLVKSLMTGTPRNELSERVLGRLPPLPTKPLMTAEELQKVTHGLTVFIEGQDVVGCYGFEARGCTDARGITLDEGGMSFLHELIHVWELQHLDPVTAAHFQWDKKGYLGLDWLYKLKSLSPELAPVNQT